MNFILKSFVIIIYLNADKIFVIDDNSIDKSIYLNINNNKVNIIYQKNIIKRNYVRKFYKKIRKKFEWLIYCDVDEFITTKKFK